MIAPAPGSCNEFGDTEVTTGSGFGGGAINVKASSKVAVCPSAKTTVTFTVAGVSHADVFIRSSEEDNNVDAIIVSSNFTTEFAVKLLPLIVTTVPLLAAHYSGLLQ